MINFDWSGAPQILNAFGGEKRCFRIPKTGLPFFDALRLYGAIDLYIGLRDEIEIHDAAYEWQVTAQIRNHQQSTVHEQVNRTAKLLKGSDLTKRDHEWIKQLDAALAGGDWPVKDQRNVSTPLDNPDSALKDGVRATAASTYKGLETGFGKESKIPCADAVLALSGQKRSETVAGIYFLPIFEGIVDFSKVVSPLRAWSGVPNILCAQVLTLLALKTSLFAEGYAEQLSAVVYNTNLDGRKFYNYSGVIGLKSTALEQCHSKASDPQKFGRFISHFYSTYRNLISRAWDRSGSATGEVEDALAHAYWLMQPTSKHRAALITSMERQKRDGKQSVLIGVYLNNGQWQEESYIKEIFMSYGEWPGDHKELRRFAKAVASGIYFVRMAKEKKDEQGKAWYDEATMLRSAPTAKAFMERALILIEQGKREKNFVGLEGREENFDPKAIFDHIGQTREQFETFRDLFRMYLIQESKPYKAQSDAGDQNMDVSNTTGDAAEGEQE